jgi:hypothetical protein
MDILSLAIGFIIGGVSGATGTYFGNKYTDERRKKEEISSKDNQWRDLYKRFPRIIDEMKEDINNPEFSTIRIFFVKDSRSIITTNEQNFQYYTDVHKDLQAAILFLQDLGFIEDITPGNVPKYRFYEHFVDRLKKS